ncbi:MAG: flagellar brake protein [Sterolibacterium sp.]|jgi:c-di-GMP-binding flagellar brake protein YcgR
MADDTELSEERIKVLRLEVAELRKLLSNEVAVQKKTLIAKAIEQRESLLAPYDAVINAMLQEAEEKKAALRREAEEQRRSMLRIELARTEEDTEFHLHRQVEIVSIFRSLKDSNETITLYFNDGNDFIISSMFSVDEEENCVVLYAGSNAATNKQAMLSGKLIAMTQLAKVKIQFVLRNIRMAQYRGRQALLADIPDSVLRLQRREYFRLIVPIRLPVKCQIPIPQPEGSPPKTVEVNVVDISAGGVGITTPPSDVPFDIDMVFEKCQIELPGDGILVATLNVRTIFEVSAKDGTASWRAGCGFVNLSGPMLSLLQRYIIKEERERKSREASLAKSASR